MFALAALVLFIIAAIAAFGHFAGVLVVLGLGMVGLACLVVHMLGTAGWAYTWRR